MPTHLPQPLALPQAIAAVNTLNGAELGGRRISVREDREDRDVKQAAGENGAPVERPHRPRGGGRAGGDRGRGRGRGPRPPIEGEPSGFQVGAGRRWGFGRVLGGVAAR